jgi:hypothetical protein
VRKLGQGLYILKYHGGGGPRLVLERWGGGVFSQLVTVKKAEIYLGFVVTFRVHVVLVHRTAHHHQTYNTIRA